MTTIDAVSNTTMNGIDTVVRRIWVMAAGSNIAFKIAAKPLQIETCMVNRTANYVTSTLIDLEKCQGIKQRQEFFKIMQLVAEKLSFVYWIFS